MGDACCIDRQAVRWGGSLDQDRNKTRITLLRVAFVLLAGVSAILGFVGYAELLVGEPGGTTAPVDVLYYTLQLFVLDADQLADRADLPWQLQVARFTAPAATVFALVETARVLLTGLVDSRRSPTTVGSTGVDSQFTVDILSALKLKDGYSLHAARGTRGARVGYRFTARRRDESRSYVRSTVVEVRLSGGLDVDGGVDVPVVVTAARAVPLPDVQRDLLVDPAAVAAHPGGREPPVHPGERAPRGAPAPPCLQHAGEGGPARILHGLRQPSPAETNNAQVLDVHRLDASMFVKGSYCWNGSEQVVDLRCPEDSGQGANKVTLQGKSREEARWHA